MAQLADKAADAEMHLKDARSTTNKGDIEQVGADGAGCPRPPQDNEVRKPSFELHGGQADRPVVKARLVTSLSISPSRWRFVEALFRVRPARPRDLACLMCSQGASSYFANSHRAHLQANQKLHAKKPDSPLKMVRFYL